MPFKSWAQRRKFMEMVKRGEISQSTFDEWDRHTDLLHLPPKTKKKSATKSQKARLKPVKMV